MSERSEQTFRISGREVLLCLVIAAALAVSIVAVIHGIRGAIYRPSKLHWDSVLLPFLLLSLPIWTKRRVHVRPDCIYAQSDQCLLWADIASAKHVLGPVIGLVVTSSTGRTVVVASSIARDPKFRAAVRSSAPPDNPLNVALRCSGPDATQPRHFEET
jgi:hypothetical protein